MLNTRELFHRTLDDGVSFELLRSENALFEAVAVLRVNDIPADNRTEWLIGRPWALHFQYMEKGWGLVASTNANVALNGSGDRKSSTVVLWVYPVPDDAVLRWLDAVNACGRAQLQASFRRPDGKLLHTVVPVAFENCVVEGRPEVFSELARWARRN